VTGSQSLERLLCAALSGASANGPLADPGGTPAVGDVALAAHSCVLPVSGVTTDATVRTAQAGSASHSGTTPALLTLQSGDGALVSAGQIIWTKSGIGANQLRQIVATVGYGTDIIAVNRDWGTVPDNTTTYKILQGLLFEILPNPVTAVIRMFSTSAADVLTGSQRTYYEKVYDPNYLALMRNYQAAVKRLKPKVMPANYDGMIDFIANQHQISTNAQQVILSILASVGSGTAGGGRRLMHMW